MYTTPASRRCDQTDPHSMVKSVLHSDPMWSTGKISLDLLKASSAGAETLPGPFDDLDDGTHTLNSHSLFSATGGGGSAGALFDSSNHNDSEDNPEINPDDGLDEPETVDPLLAEDEPAVAAPVGPAGDSLGTATFDEDEVLVEATPVPGTVTDGGTTAAKAASAVAPATPPPANLEPGHFYTGTGTKQVPRPDSVRKGRRLVDDVDKALFHPSLGPKRMFGLAYIGWHRAFNRSVRELISPADLC